MSPRKKMTILIVAILAWTSIVLVLPVPHSTITIGVIQTASHPALDAVRTNMLTTLKEKLGTQMHSINYNAEGMLPLAEGAAKSLHSKNHISAIVTIGTLATQAMTRTESVTPIVFSAVSDISSLHIAHSNVCGMSDGIHSDYVINSVQKLLPNAKKIALVYNPSEANSAASVSQLRESIQKSGLSSLCCGVTSEVDCLHATRSACQQADVVVVPQDNTVASALPQVAKEALRAKKPLIICYKTQLMSGVFAALGASYEEIGRQTANMVLEIVLSKKSPEQLSVQMAPASSIKIHRSTAEHLGIIIPQELLPTIEWEDSL